MAREVPAESIPQQPSRSVRAGPLCRLCPSYVASSLQDVRPEWLSTQGIRALIIDLDNTLVEWHGEVIGPEIANWVAEMGTSGLRMCIASNTHRPGRLRRLAERLRIGYAPGVAKPARAGMERAMGILSARPDETAVIGDQVLTDILGGNRCGILTILVRPLSSREFVGTRVISRPIERLLLSYFRKRGWLVPVAIGIPAEP